MLIRSLPLILALLLPACARPPQFVSATIRGRGQPLRLIEPTEVAKLASFFPGVGTGKSNAGGGGWIGTGSIDFTRATGKTTHVMYDLHYRVWSEGHGDFEVEPGLRDYLMSIEAAHATSAISACDDSRGW